MLNPGPAKSYAATSLKIEVCSWYSWNFGIEHPCPLPCGDVSSIETIRSASGYPSGFSNTAFTTVKIAVFAPMPRARAATAAIVNPGLLMKRCSACLMSFQRSVITTTPFFEYLRGCRGKFGHTLDEKLA